MLFKKKKKAQMITLGLGSSANAREGERAVRPPIQPVLKKAPEPLGPETDPTPTMPALPVERVQPAPARETESIEAPVRVPAAPAAESPAAPRETPSPAEAEQVDSAPPPDEAAKESALQTVSVTSGLPVDERVDEIGARQCPFCLAYVRPVEGRCDVCGNLLDTDVSGSLAAPPAISEPVPDPAAGIVTSADAPDVPPELETDGLNDTKAMAESPVPSVLKDTKILLPAVLKIFGRKSERQAQFSLNIGRTTIGRDQDNDLPFPDEEFISRHHCQIIYQKYQYVLQDPGSANGTYVNDVKVRETALRDGDLIQIGPLRFLFEDPVEKMKKLETRYAEAAADPAEEEADQN